MKKWIIATAAATTLFASAGAASAQWMNNNQSNDGWNSGYSQRGPMMDRNVSMPAYGERRMAPSNYGYSRPGNTGSTYDSSAFKSQEVWPQSPPTGS